MTAWMLRSNFVKASYDEVVVLFANTGEEDERTLEFVRRCDRDFGFGTIWVEAVVNPKHGIGITHRVVNFKTASRKGEPFEAMIRKYGIPCSSFPSCTRDLKLNPMKSYLRSIGWAPRTYHTAIGIRADEIDRMNPAKDDLGIVYPCIEWLPVTKTQVNSFWANDAPFRLQIRGYEGNCKTCWKKSKRKLMTIMLEHPERFDFFARMERHYAMVGPEFAKGDLPGYKRSFFRGGQSVSDLKKEVKKLPLTFVRAEDDRVKFDPDWDLGSSCEESCEVFSAEDLT